jgi:ferredoxin-nitrite reductase
MPVSEPLESPACPGLFYETPAQSAVLTRIRVTGGLLSRSQAQAIAAFAQAFGNGQVEVTNRANLQVRSLVHSTHINRLHLPPAVFQQFQALGLAAPHASVDHLRNVMLSPTTGLDQGAIADPRSLLQALDHWLSHHPELAALSPKFSIGIDAGEMVSIRDRKNDIFLIATSATHYRLCFWLDTLTETGLAFMADDAVAVVQAIAQVYLEFVDLFLDQTTDRQSDRSFDHNPDHNPDHKLDRKLKPQYRRSRRPRLSQLIQHWGLSWFVQQMLTHIPQRAAVIPEHPPSTTRANACQQTSHRPAAYGHLGIHAQSQPDYYYIGIVIPLGLLTSTQLNQLTDCAIAYGTGQLRLTPWQNLLIPHVHQSQLSALQQTLQSLGFSWQHNHLFSAIVACSGKSGCVSSATHTREDAIAVVQQLESQWSDRLDLPLNLHFTGCPKRCAQRQRSDLTLLGMQNNDNNSGNSLQIFYEVQASTLESTLNLTLESTQTTLCRASPDELPRLIDRFLHIYQRDRSSPQESFAEFTQRHSIADLQRLFEIPS